MAGDICRSWFIFEPLRLNKTHFPDCVILKGQCASAVNVVSSNPRIGPYQELRYLFPYYQHAQMSSYELQKQRHFFP